MNFQVKYFESWNNFESAMKSNEKGNEDWLSSNFVVTYKQMKSSLLILRTRKKINSPYKNNELFNTVGRPNVSNRMSDCFVGCLNVSVGVTFKKGFTGARFQTYGSLRTGIIRLILRDNLLVRVTGIRCIFPNAALLFSEHHRESRFTFHANRLTVYRASCTLIVGIVYRIRYFI